MRRGGAAGILLPVSADSNDAPGSGEQARLDALEGLSIVYTPAEERFDRITRLAARLLRAPIATVSLVGARQTWFKSRHGMRLSEVPRRDGFAPWAIRADGPFVVPDALADQRFTCCGMVTGEPHARAYAGVALRAPDGSRIGALGVIDTVPRAFEPEDLSALRDLASMAEDQLRHMELTSAQAALARELDDARRRILIDPLTQAWNRAGLDALLAREVEFATDRGRPFALAMIDIDHFKAVNDTHGHPAGDGILVEFAERLRVAARPQDAVCRFGGEEFVVLLPGCAPDDAPLVADRIRRRIAADPFRISPDESVPLTCSVGVASWARGEDPSVLVMRADVALYDAKRAGRDRVNVAAPLRAPSSGTRAGSSRSYHPDP